MLEDELPEVRMFVIADHAVMAPDGKMYLNGAGIDQVLLPATPGHLPAPLYIAVRIRVPWHLTSESLRLRIRALDADRQPFGPDPLIEGQVGAGIAGLPVPGPGTIHFPLELAHHTLGILPLKINVRPPTAVPGA